jgi:hypothetical protein
MSLDVSLVVGDARLVPCEHCGGTGKINEEPGEVWEGNVTHNLTEMADAAGIYEAIWRPERLGITKAKQLIEPLTVGLAVLEADPPAFRKHNAPNGWGMYEHFVTFVKRYLTACIEHPDASVRASG